MHDEELYSILIGTKLTSNDRSVSLTAIFPYYESALRRPGVNMMMLWGEYRQGCLIGYRYSRFCELFSAWHLKKKSTMHLEHQPGDKL
jgi:hypothetical protein